MEANRPTAGWLIELIGHEFDLSDWRQALCKPFDPIAELLSDGVTALRSEDFKDLQDASEVKAKGSILIARLNGALSLWNDAKQIEGGAVYRIDENGSKHNFDFLTGRAEIRFKAFGCLTSAGQMPEIPEINRSEPQLWNQLAVQNDQVSDLLDHLGRCDNWYDIYKTVEFAELLVGGQHKLAKLLGADANEIKLLKTNANFYRHARAHRPKQMIALGNAKAGLKRMARSVLMRLERSV